MGGRVQTQWEATGHRFNRNRWKFTEIHRESSERGHSNIRLAALYVARRTKGHLSIVRAMYAGCSGTSVD